MEYAVAHGYLMATVKGHADKRARHWQKPGDAPRPSQDWARALAAKSGVRGAGSGVIASTDSPVSGTTVETFRAEVAAMRAAEYARSKGGVH